jgi:hypothetical protein
MRLIGCTLTNVGKGMYYNLLCKLLRKWAQTLTPLDFYTGCARFECRPRAYYPDFGLSLQENVVMVKRVTGRGGP